MERICNRCQLSKPLEDFAQNGNGLLKRARKCKTCAALYAQEYREQNYNKVYAAKFKTDEHTVAELLAREVCDLCGDAPTGNKRNAIDHCHETGKIRGILCWPCNKALGSFKDNPELMRKAALYIEKHNGLD